MSNEEILEMYGFLLSEGTEEETDPEYTADNIMEAVQFLKQKQREVRI